MEQESQSVELVFYPWPGHKPSVRERDSCSVQSRIWECSLGSGKYYSWISVLLGRES